ncbi:MAG: hypothetical protein BWK76_25105 [Desulfobulbaceae bacterium A2]|nr:MAG: hypothetical protein BWK76_25105 [Desulfobulbaceae bacterium A2]
MADALEGNEKAREWLSKFLVGIPKMPAQRPFTIVVQQLADINPEREAAAAIMAERKRNLFFDFEHQEALMQMESVDGAEED